MGETTYYFNSHIYDIWTNNPGYMVDGSEVNNAATAINGDINRLTANSYDGYTDYGTISKVEIRCKAMYANSGSNNCYVQLVPIFGPVLKGDTHSYQLPLSTLAWSSWYDITSDTNAPNSWAWTDIDALNANVVFSKTAPDTYAAYCSKVEIRVTYTGPTTVTFYFNNYAQVAWTAPQNMMDNSTSTWGNATGDSKAHTFDDISAASKPGAITKVYVRWSRRGSSNGSSTNKIAGQMRFTNGDGAFIWDQSFTANAAWSSWTEITSDTNAPSPWTWTDLDNLSITLSTYDVDGNKTFYISSAEVKVEYGILDTLEESVTFTDSIAFITGMPIYYYEPSTTSQFTISSPDILEFSGLEEDDSLIRNYIIVLGTGVRATTSDSTSISTYGRYTYRYKNEDITDSTDAATIAGQILTNYKNSKSKGSFKIKGKTGVTTRQQFTLKMPELGLTSEEYEIVQYNHSITGSGFYTTIYFGEAPWDITREVTNLLRTVY